MLKKIVIYLSFILSFNLAAKDYVLIDKIIVTVEKDVITSSELEAEKGKIIKSLRGSENINDNNTLEKKALKNLIQKKLILQYGQQSQLIPSEEELDNVIANIITSNNISIEDLENDLNEQGIALRDFKEQLKYDITVQKIKNREIMPYVNVSEYEIDAWLKSLNENIDKEYKITHLLIKDNNGAEEKIKEIQKKIKDGNKLDELAKIYSDGPNSENGGDLGWNNIEEIPEIFSQFILSANEGDVSDIIKSSNGYHLIKLESIKNNKKAKTILVKQLKFLQILFKFNAISSDEDHKSKLNNIKNLISDGLEFSEAVKKYSEEQYFVDPKNLNWVNYDDLLPEFRKNIGNQDINKIYGPFKTELGWHLVKIYEKRDEDFTDENERQKAKIEIARKKTNIRFIDWIDAIEKNSKIKILNE